MLDIITDNLDVWTTVELPKKSGGRGRGKATKKSPHGIQKLRELILELAVRGKLVPQDPNDEPASELLKKVSAEKTKLIKKQKPLPPIEPEELPYELPRSWVWTRLPDITFFQEGPGIMAKDFRDTGIPLIRIAGMHNDLVSLEGCNFLDEDMFKKKWAHFKLELGDVVLSSSASLGKVSKVDDETVGCIVYTGLIRFQPYACLHADYLIRFLNSNEFLSQINKSKTGAAIMHFGPTHLKRMLVPLAPLAEQYRIVAKVDELMALCDKLEHEQSESGKAHQVLVQALLSTLTQAQDSNELNAAWQRIAEHFDTLFTTEASIDQLKQTILQLAVMGKLVPQDTTDVPASELLKKIAAEKTKLVKEKKIKKQKAMTDISDEEMVNGLPDSWSSARLANFTIVGTGATPSREKMDYYIPAEFNWVSSGETSNSFISETKEKISALALKETNVTVYPVGTLIVAMYGQGKTRGQVTELLIEAGTNQACAAIQMIENSAYHRKFLKLFFQKAYEELRSHAAGGAQPNLNVGKISRTVVPLPPLNEQKRIVAKVDELMAICDSLKARLNEAQTTQVQLADTIVEQAVG